MDSPLEDPATWRRHETDWREMAVDCRANAAESVGHGFLHVEWSEMADTCEAKAEACRLNAELLEVQ